MHRRYHCPGGFCVYTPSSHSKMSPLVAASVLRSLQVAPRLASCPAPCQLTLVVLQALVKHHTACSKRLCAHLPEYWQSGKVPEAGQK